MFTLSRGSFRVETAAIPEPGGACFVTAEVFEGRRMVRSYWRRVERPDADMAERDVAEDVARMSGEAE
jgi:hypothetical protein